MSNKDCEEEFDKLGSFCENNWAADECVEAKIKFYMEIGDPKKLMKGRIM